MTKTKVLRNESKNKIESRPKHCFRSFLCLIIDEIVGCYSKNIKKRSEDLNPIINLLLRKRKSSTENHENS